MLSVAVGANDELCFQTNFRGLTKILGFVKSSAQKGYDILKPCEVVLQPKAPAISNPDLSFGSTILETIQTLCAVLSTL